MSDSVDVIVKQRDNKQIVLYSHWGGYNIEETLAKALDRGRSRWGDPAYLTRVIFCEMIGNDIDDWFDTTGFAIDTEPGAGDKQIVVNVLDDEVDGISFEDYINEYA